MSKHELLSRFDRGLGRQKGPPSRRSRIVIIGAGIGGLSAGMVLAGHGHDVTIVEAQATPGGKMRQIAIAGQQLDAGPTVFTMRPIFEMIFAEAGADFASSVPLVPMQVMARHFWQDQSLPPQVKLRYHVTAASPEHVTTPRRCPALPFVRLQARFRANAPPKSA